VARLERMPEDPRQELVVALAGPAVNVVLALFLLVLLVPATALSHFGDVRVVGGHFLSKLVWVNVALAVFNLIPAFPMDGGRVLRALLAMRMEYVRATEIAAKIGQGWHWCWGSGAILESFPGFHCAVRLDGGRGRSGHGANEIGVGRIPIRQVMITDYQILSPQDPLSRAVEHILAGFQQDFPVVSNGQVVGMLTRADLMTVLAKERSWRAGRRSHATHISNRRPRGDGGNGLCPLAGVQLPFAARGAKRSTGRHSDSRERWRIPHDPIRVEQGCAAEIPAAAGPPSGTALNEASAPCGRCRCRRLFRAIAQADFAFAPPVTFCDLLAQ